MRTYALMPGVLVAVVACKSTPPATHTDAPPGGTDGAVGDAVADGTTSDAMVDGPIDAVMPDATPVDPPAPSGTCSKTGWCWHNALPQGNTLWAAANIGSEIWAVGSHSTVLRWDGMQWVRLAVPTIGDNRALRGVWGSGPNDVWIVGDRTLHWDGSALADVTILGGRSFNAVWGTGPNDVWVAGNFGNVAHSMGGAFVAVDAGTTKDLYGIAGTSATDVWFAGVNSTLTHYDGSTFTPASLPNPRSFYAIAARASNDVWAVGPAGAAVHWDGTAWTEHLAPEALFSVAMTGTEVLAGGGRVYRWDGTAWSALGVATPAIRGLAVDGTPAFAVGDFGTMHRRTIGGAFVPYSENFCYRCLFRDVYVVSPTDVWILGDFFRLRWNGAAWTFTATTTSSRNAHGTAATDIWFVGASGTIEHWDGAAFTSHASPTTESLNSVFSISATDVWAVGGRAVLHYDGTAWAAVPVPEAGGFFGHVWASGPNDVWVAGNLGAYRWNGTAWTKVRTGARDRIWGTGASDVWLTGGASAVDHFDGTTFTTTIIGPGAGITSAIWGRAANDVFVDAAYGLFRFDGTTWHEEERGAEPLTDLEGAITNATTRVWATAGSGEILSKDI